MTRMDARDLLPLIAHILETNAEAQRTQAGSMPAPSPRRWDPWERGRHRAAKGVQVLGMEGCSFQDCGPKRARDSDLGDLGIPG